jgi:hypothetical protein
LGDAVDDLPPDGLIARLDHGGGVLFRYSRVAFFGAFDYCEDQVVSSQNQHLGSDADAVVVDQNNATYMIFTQSGIGVSL